MRGDRSVRGSQCGRDGDRSEETVQPQRRRSFSLGTAAVSAGAPESELTRHLNEMDFLSAHRSSNPTTPATQCSLGAVISEHGNGPPDTGITPCDLTGQ